MDQSLYPGFLRAAVRRRAWRRPGRGAGPDRDAYGPLVIGLFCRLARPVYFQVASGLGGMFLGAAPPSSAIEESVLGLARPAYFTRRRPLARGDGDVWSSRSTAGGPTATDQEIASDAGRGATEPRMQVSAASWRGEAAAAGPEEAAEEGGHGKNGRSATLVVMCTLRQATTAGCTAH